MNKCFPQMNLTSCSANPIETKDIPNATKLRQLVAMRFEENGKPLFCIHPSGGDIGIYRKFASRTGPALSVIGIQSRLLCGATTEFSTLEEMAFDYCCLVNQHQPTGDIRLLGFSLGGFVASLMAQKLQQSGRAVSFLGLIDSNPNWTTAAETSRRELCLRLAQVFTKFQSIGVLRQQPLETVQKDVAILVDSCLVERSTSGADVMARIKTMGYIPSQERDAQLLMKFANSFLAHCRLLKDFEPPEIDCPLYLWWPSETSKENESGARMWIQKSNVTVSESVIEGSHYSIMRGAAVKVLSAEVEAAIAHENAMQNSA